MSPQQAEITRGATPSGLQRAPVDRGGKRRAMMKPIVRTTAICLLFAIAGLSPAHAAWVPNGVAVAPSPDPVPGVP
jgi:hypothetical protein